MHHLTEDLDWLSVRVIEEGQLLPTCLFRDQFRGEVHVDTHLDVSGVRARAKAIGTAGHPGPCDVLARSIRLCVRQVSEVTHDGLVSITVGLIHGQEEPTDLPKPNLKLLVSHGQPGIKSPH